MPIAKAARGRPRGTGLNDHSVLKSVIELIAANPELKPTTAIKAVGISDPSAIRRLRDKLQGNYKELAPAPPRRKLQSEAKIAPPLAQPARTLAVQAIAEPVLTAPLEIQAGRSKPGPRPEKQLEACRKRNIEAGCALEPVADPAPQRPSLHAYSSWFELWAELSLQSISASFSTQLIIYDHVIHSAPVTVAFGSHAALTGFAAAWCATSPASSKAIH